MLYIHFMSAIPESLVTWVEGVFAATEGDGGL